MSIERPTPARPLKIGTRGSPLALAQANETRARLAEQYDLPFEACQVVVIRTTGDRVLDRPLREIDGKGLFVKEIEEAMIRGEIDIAVHSTKDMPVAQPDGLLFDCFLPREDPRDAFISHRYDALADLPDGAKLGTSSTRRRAQVLHRFPKLDIVEFRGNVQTRLKKLEDGVAEATFLAMAGLKRLDMVEVARSAVATRDMLPALAQGVIGIECRAGDLATRDLLAPLHHAETATRLQAERAFLKALDGSCETPIAGLAELDGDTLRLRGEILRPDGSDIVEGADTAPAQDAAALGRELGERLKAQAGPDFLTL